MEIEVLFKEREGRFVEFECFCGRPGTKRASSGLNEKLQLNRISEVAAKMEEKSRQSRLAGRTLAIK